MTYQQLLTLLFAQQDEAYRLFNLKIVPTSLKVIGVRSPQMGKILKQLKKEGGNLEGALWHDYLEVDFIVANITLSKDIPLVDKYRFIEDFMKGADNWAIVDSASGAFQSTDFILAQKWIKRFIQSPYPFVRRFGYVHALNNFVCPEYVPTILSLMAKDEHYYVRMAEAWLLCECFLKDPALTEKYLSESTLDDWTINKAISKISDSFRVTDEVKEKLKKYRRVRKTR